MTNKSIPREVGSNDRLSLQPERADGQHYEHYADRAPPGCYLLHDETPAAVGDMAYIGLIGGQWVRVRRGMNIAGATLNELMGWGLVLALARTSARRPTSKSAAHSVRCMEHLCKS